MSLPPFEGLACLIGRSATDPEVRVVVGSQQVKRLPPQAFVELKRNGVAIMFEEIDPARPFDSALAVTALHFYSEGYEGYSQYRGVLPGDLTFGDAEPSITDKLGSPTARGGGGFSPLLKKPIPHWLKYPLGRSILHLQLDRLGRVEMVSVFVERE